MTTEISTEEWFKRAQEFINNGPKDANAPEANNEQKLKFYAYFKQASSGKNNSKKPGAFDFVAKAKWDAWNKLGDMNKEEAMKGYIKTLEEVNPKWKSHFEKKNESSTSVTANPTNGTSKSSQKTFASNFLAGRVAVVTGGGSGIGKTITEKLMEYGCDTVILSRTLSKLQTAAQEMEQKYGRKCVPMAVDVRDYNALSKIFDDVVQKFGKFDILVNGAAGNFLCPAENLSPNAFKTVMEIDTFGTFYASKLAFEKSFKKNGGNIINLSMTLHYTGSPLQVHAGVAKAGIDTMTKHLAVEWGQDNVRINAIAIGPIEGTEGMKRLMPGQFQKALVNATPLKRMGKAEDIANAVLFLVSDAASYVTGSIVTVDGGNWLTSSGLMYPQAFEMVKKQHQSKM